MDLVRIGISVSRLSKGYM